MKELPSSEYDSLVSLIEAGKKVQKDHWNEYDRAHAVSVLCDSLESIELLVLREQKMRELLDKWLAEGAKLHAAREETDYFKCADELRAILESP